MAENEGSPRTTRDSIYRVARSIKRRDNSLYNALRSIYQDSLFVEEISNLWPKLPLLANLRCGLWYSPRFDATCYFKSTDGHTNNLSFNTSRLNLHLPLLAGEKGGCIIIDSTRKGKRFPDSMSKTIPIWCCVLNRSIYNHLKSLCNTNNQLNDAGFTSDDHGERSIGQLLDTWDCSLHMPLWVSKTEKASIEARLDEWVKQLEESGADIASLASCLRKPLRPLWVSQKTVIWLNEVPDHESWDFTPLILVSASDSGEVQQYRNNSEFSWSYIPGAGDDEESWSRGLSPSVFWNHVDDLIDSGPEVCNKKVAEIVESDRVYRAQRGQEAPQIVVKNSKANNGVKSDETLSLSVPKPRVEMMKADEGGVVSWLASTNLALGSSQVASKVLLSMDCCILNCDKNPVSVPPSHLEEHLHLPMTGSKFDRFSILKNLPTAVSFAKMKMSLGKKLLVCCQDGEDISVCVCLAILISLFNEEGTYDGGRSFEEKSITKLEMRRMLIFICKYAVNARPSRGNLRQAFGFLSSQRENSDE